MRMSFILFYLVWVTILALAYGYVGWRLIESLQLKGRRRAIAWGAVATVFLMPQASFLLLFRRAESSWTDALSWPAYIGLGFFSLLLTLLVLRDVALAGGSLIRKAGGVVLKARAPRRPDPDEVDAERRRFLMHSSSLGAIALSGVTTGYGLYEAQRRMAKIEEIAVPIPDLPKGFEGFRIAQITDIHVGPTIKRGFVERIAEQVNGLGADVVALTGDLVDGSVSWLREDVAPLKELCAPEGKFFITGNHEYYSGAESWIEEADRLGFTVLLNEHRVLRRAGDRIIVAGVTDSNAGNFIKSQASDPKASLADAPAGLVKLLLAHQPRSVFQAAQAGFDLQLSGHTHGGQFFPWNHVVALNQPYIKGLHRHGNMWIYVSRGTGYWGPPLRIGIPPEITLVTLTRGSTARNP